MQVNSVNELNGLLIGKFPKVKITFNNSILRKKDEKKLNAYVTECGCNTGTYFLVAGIMLSISMFVISGLSIMSNILFSILICFVFAIAGKLIGLGYARYNFYKLLRKILLNIG